MKIWFLNVQANIFLKQILWRKKNKPIGLQRFSKNQNQYVLLVVSYEILILKFQTPSIRLWCLAKHLMFIWMTKLWVLNKLYLQNLKAKFNSVELLKETKNQNDVIWLISMNNINLLHGTGAWADTAATDRQSTARNILRANGNDQ